MFEFRNKSLLVFFFGGSLFLFVYDDACCVCIVEAPSLKSLVVTFSLDDRSGHRTSTLIEH